MFDEHPKVLALLDEEDQADAFAAITLWTLCFTWAQRNTRRRGKTPGLLPSGLPRKQIGPVGREAAKTLVKHGLWDEASDGGWMIHDFADYLPDKETRAARAEAGRRGAEARWGKRHDDGNLPSDNGIQPIADGNLPSASHEPDGKQGGKRLAKDGSRASARRGTTSSSSTELPIPEPDPIPPPAGAIAPSLTVGQRSKRITDAYAKAEPMCKWTAVNGIVQLAIKSEKFTDQEIEDALLRMAEVNRSVTVDALRTELVGLPASRPRASPTPALPSEQQLEAEWKGLKK